MKNIIYYKERTMISYKEQIAQILASQIEGLEKEEIVNMIETPADSKMGDYAFP